MSSIVRKVALVASVLVLVPSVQVVPGSAGGRAYVRVNQVGYVQDRAKQAFLLSTADHDGESFDLVGDGGVVAFSGSIGVDRGPWNDRFGHVNQIDFDGFANPGVYVLKDADGRALYVGKAVNLRRRLRAHFADRRWRALKPGM